MTMRENRIGRRTRAVSAVVIGALIAALAAVVPTMSATANDPGSSMYTRSSPDERLAYSRVIRLEHSGSENGTLLGTFEHATTNGASSDFVIRRSTDDGTTWSTLTTVSDPLTGANHPSDQLWQPFLYEFPTQIGRFPAGTLVLLGNMAPSTKDATNFVFWRSTDHGASWSYEHTLQSGGGSVGAPHGGSGVWEPFVTMNGRGQLVMFFSDERTEPGHAQILAHVVSNDGGLTWSANPDGSTNFAPGLVVDVESTSATDRPGMPTVAILPNGDMVLAYEICGDGRNCEAHTKTSTDDGDTFGTGSSDLGTQAVTDDGRYLGSSPYIVWTPAGGPNGQLLLTGMRTRYASSNGFTPEDRQAIFVKDPTSTGDWSWMPAPFEPTTASAVACSASYSPDLLLSEDGRRVRYTTATAVGSTGCAENTEEGTVGALPYASDFAAGQSGWIGYGGCWTTSNAILSDTCGGSDGDKSIAGSTGWTNYTLTGDIRIDSGGQAGLLVRATDPGVGADALHGYYVGVTATRLFMGREDGGWTELASTALPAGLPKGAWYHMSVRVSGCTISVTGRPEATTMPISLTHTDTGCLPHGAVGVRDQGATASWRSLTVTAN